MVFASREQLQKIIILIEELDELLLDVSEVGHSDDFKQFTRPIRQAAYKALKYYENRLIPVLVDAANVSEFPCPVCEGSVYHFSDCPKR